MAFVEVEISASDVLDAMNEDAGFALDMWVCLAERLHMGLMADNLGDILATMDNDAHARWIIAEFEETFGRLAALHEARNGGTDDG